MGQKLLRAGALAAGTLVVAAPLTPVATLANAAGSCIKVANTCYPTVQAAVDAAHPGQTVRIPAGHFRGGVVVTKSITLVGAGADRTHLVGGEHVLTIGAWQATHQPTVTLRALTLRGGHNHSSPESVDFTGHEGIIAGGAGLEIPGGDNGGATVKVVDSVITHNLSTPVAARLPETPEEEEFWPHCPDGFCTFSGALGGGVENWGDLTLVRTTVAGNQAAGPITSDADGGGIFSAGNLTLIASAVHNNRARAIAPHGRFPEGGGVFMSFDTTLKLRSSSVNRNSAYLQSTNPVQNPDGTTTEMLANSGGIHVDDESFVDIRSSHIDGNRAVVDNPQGMAPVINAGLQLTVSDLRLVDSTVSRNRAIATVKTVGDFGPLGSALQWCNLAHVSGLRAVGNVTRVTATHGAAGSAGAVFAGATLCNGFDPGMSTLRESVIRHNLATASAHGRADVLGAGINVASSLLMRDTIVADNRAHADGLSGDTQGGGIWNGMFPLPEFDDLHSNLHLNGVRVVHNRVSGETPAGGGIYTRDPIHAVATIVRGNVPDQCVGCTTSKQQRSVGRDRAAPHRVFTDPLRGFIVRH